MATFLKFGDKLCWQNWRKHELFCALLVRMHIETIHTEAIWQHVLKLQMHISSDAAILLSGIYHTDIIADCKNDTCMWLFIAALSIMENVRNYLNLQQYGVVCYHVSIQWNTAQLFFFFFKE